MNTSRLPDRDTLLALLDRVLDPRSGKGLVSAGLVQGLSVRNGRAGFMMEAPAGMLELYEPVRAAAEAALSQAPGVEKAQVVLTNTAGDGPPPPPAEGVTRVRKGVKLTADPQATPAPPVGATRPPNVRRVIAVASGKGGVGKSTVSVSLAVSLAALGLRVGLLDADVYGPSAPRMLGADGDPEFHPEKKLIPLEAWGVKVMSIGFMVDEGAPMIWRGPMASSAVRQMMHEVAWGSEEAPLDVLVVDMPPGTGDIQLTMVQKHKPVGAVIVSTPQDLALIDATRAVSLFTQAGVPMIGLVENMAGYACPHCGEISDPFGTGGAETAAGDMAMPFLGRIPLAIDIRRQSDAGDPPAAGEGVHADAFRAIAQKVAAWLNGPA